MYGCSLETTPIISQLLAATALFAWLIGHGWKYGWLICCERKILFVDWKSTVYKPSEQGEYVPCLLSSSLILRLLDSLEPGSVPSGCHQQNAPGRTVLRWCLSFRNSIHFHSIMRRGTNFLIRYITIRPRMKAKKLGSVVWMFNFESFCILEHLYIYLL